MMKLKDIVKMERIKRGWTLEEVGIRINKSTNAIWHYENGSRTIDSETLEEYGKLFGYEWRKTEMSKEEFKTVRELYRSLPEKQAYNSLGKFYYKWKPEELNEREKKLCKDINEQLGLYGYQLKNKGDAGTYNDIVNYMNMEIVSISDEIDFEATEDVLIQNLDDLSYVGLCTGRTFRYKRYIDGKYQEVFTIEKEDDGYRLTTFSPLTEIERTYGYVEECFYNLIPYNVLKLTEEEKNQVYDYFGEDY